MTEKIKYIGCDDPELELFESQYDLPEGMCYNSFVILDEKVAVMDSVDKRKTDEWLDKLEKALDGRKPDYLIAQHYEPDHSGSVGAFRARYPEAVIVASAKALQFAAQFDEKFDAAGTKAVKEGDVLSLGQTTLQFITAPMVHWPEVIMTWCPEEKVFFSADAFGKFGVKDADPDDWACEARRYYFNICGKYGAPVSTALKKAGKFDIETICPLHGPILTGEKLAEALRLYNIWSKYDVETKASMATLLRWPRSLLRSWRQRAQARWLLPTSAAMIWPRPSRMPSVWASWWFVLRPTMPTSSHPCTSSFGSCR